MEQIKRTLGNRPVYAKTENLARFLNEEVKPLVLELRNRVNALLVAPTPEAGTVTLVSVVDANGVSGTVATPTTTPEITLLLGDITPTSVTVTGPVLATNVFPSPVLTRLTADVLGAGSAPPTGVLIASPAMVLGASTTRLIVTLTAQCYVGVGVPAQFQYRVTDGTTHRDFSAVSVQTSGIIPANYQTEIPATPGSTVTITVYFQTGAQCYAASNAYEFCTLHVQEAA